MSVGALSPPVDNALFYHEINRILAKAVQEMMSQQCMPGTSSAGAQNDGVALPSDSAGSSSAMKQVLAGQTQMIELLTKMLKAIRNMSKVLGVPENSNNQGS
ncbi:hypothetical protein QAD02_019384 [Eretmocerus hayati]|uniref:Uncharacterized protein n=1 Tax=Eretmocerus hayati TaxID=131215 RepID=A0ACC2PMK7_9HYME|nr:hypothetical protein QAD02_019384 [Eretmocerus hayati]